MLMIFLLLFLSRLLFLSARPIYFDSPEYLRLIANPSIFHALTLGHEPIHPGFILPAWILYRVLPLSSLYSAELVSSMMAALGLLIFYKITKLYFDKQTALRALIIASFLPVLFLAGVNALTDATYIFFYIFSFYSLSRLVFNRNTKMTDFWKNRWFWIGILSLGYSVFTHIQVVIWLPLFFTPLLFHSDITKKPTSNSLNESSTLISFDEGSTLKYVGMVMLFLVVAVMLGVLSLIILLVLAGNSVQFSLNLLFMHGGDFISSQNTILAFIRASRNVGITLLRNNSTLVVIYAIFGLFILLKKNRKQAVLLLIWFFPVILSSQYWHIGLFGRTSLMASFSLAILSAQVKPKILFIILVLQLLLIIIPLAFVNKNADVHSKLISMYEEIPHNAVFISSNLIRPQVAFYGETYFINEPGQDIGFIKSKINSALKNKRRVFIDSQAIFNPYAAMDGNNLHILSLGSTGKSGISSLFKLYSISIVQVFDARKRIYIYEINTRKKLRNGIIRGNALPGDEIFLYSHNLEYRVNPMRVDYYDAGTWIWTLLTNKKEPVLWGIADKNGIYELPEVENAYLKKF